MAACLVCMQTCSAIVWCQADKAFLCGACDQTIHSANVISRSHKRLPVCELCKRNPAAVYCHEDAAALCTRCEVEVHSANPLPHKVVAIEQALVDKLIKNPPLPFLLPTAGAEERQQQPEQAPAGPAEDEVSACGEHQGAAQEPSLPQQSSEVNTASVAVVPEMPKESPAIAAFNEAGSKSLWNAKDLEAAFDLEASLFGGFDMGFDFHDILDNTSDGMVPTLSAALDDLLPAPAPAATPAAAPAPAPASAPAESQELKPFVLDLAKPESSLPLPEDELVVPSFLTDDLVDSFHFESTFDTLEALGQEAFLPSTDLCGKRTVRPASLELQAPPPPAKHTTTNNTVLAPPPPPPAKLSPPPRAPLMLVKSEPSSAPVTRGSHNQSAVQVPVNGANLTREQRVARYREKRKNRKFQKTIRYASRKAYAEVRPRIKGRFATKEEVEAWKARKAAGCLLGPDDVIEGLS